MLLSVGGDIYLCIDSLCIDKKSLIHEYNYGIQIEIFYLTGLNFPFISRFMQMADNWEKHLFSKLSILIIVLHLCMIYHEQIDTSYVPSSCSV